MSLRYTTDIAIFGGGVAGLWLLARLRAAGYSALLLESGHLGGGQSLASQGIIHGGLKYALHGSLSAAAQTIADMPARWRSALAGEDEVDLRDVALLSQHYYMWSESGMRSRIKTFLGSKSLRGRIESVAERDYPDFFRSGRAKGSLFRLPDFVLDTGSLLASLASRNKEWLFKIDADRIGFGRDESGRVANVLLGQGEQTVELAAGRFIFAAGGGNEGLIESAGLSANPMQRRPLHMVMLRGPGLAEVHAHCIGSDFSMTPSLTVTTHTRRDGERVWYLGGALAESGVERDPSAQGSAAITAVQRAFPWLDTSGVSTGSLRIDRAEAAYGDDARPDDVFAKTTEGVTVAWPTKLTLTPALADRVLEQMQGVTPGTDHASSEELRRLLPAPALAPPPWNDAE